MKITVYSNWRVEAFPEQPMTGIADDRQQRMACESLAKEIKRHCDAVGVSVNVDAEDQCSFCHYRWEVDDAGLPVCCDKAREEHMQQKALV